MDELKKVHPEFKTHILLPVIFALTTALAVSIMAVDGFLVDLGAVVIWFYFAVVLGYVGVAIVDLCISKTKSKKLKIFIVIMASLTLIADVLYAIFYIIKR